MLIETWLPILAALLFGLLIGSFLNVVIYRLPIMMERSWMAEARQALQMSPQNPRMAKYSSGQLSIITRSVRALFNHNQSSLFLC